MDRKEFLLLVGKGAALAGVAYCVGCSANSDSFSTDPPSNIDFTIDISQSPYTALAAAGGAVIKDGVIMARLSDNSIVAVSSICTHQGSTINYEASNTRFHCPNHGSNFATNGSVINGPATTALKVYTTTLNGTTLRVQG